MTVNDYHCLICKHYHQFTTKWKSEDRIQFWFGKCWDCNCEEMVFDNLKYLEYKYQERIVK
jgi:hypothetical protein